MKPQADESRWRSSSAGDSSFLLLVFLEDTVPVWEAIRSGPLGLEVLSALLRLEKQGDKRDGGASGTLEQNRGPLLGRHLHLPPSGTHPGPSFSQGTGPRDGEMWQPPSCHACQ